MKQLLEKIKIIDFKYQTINKKENFNLFTILRKYNDEVNLHSRFINELLNPKGTHNLGDTFLKLFFKTIGFKNFTISNKTSVDYEKYIGKINEDETEGGQIDLLIENIGFHHIIIENKIHAGDQTNQLLRYKNYKKNGVIYYLTLDGSDPSQGSLGKPRELGTLDISEVNCISYKNEIRNWIQLCIEKASLIPELRESLLQYLNLINKLIGETSNMEERMEIIELLSKDNNVIAALKIAENWVHLKWHTEFDFWREFEHKIITTSDYQISEIQKYTSNCIDNSVHSKRSKNPWYGLLFKIAKINNIDYCIFIERGDENLYFGLLMLNQENERITNENNHFTLISKEIEKFTEDRNQSWLGWKSLEPKINFALFNNENTLMLANPKKRKKYIDENWKEIEKFIDKCKIEIEASYNTNKQ